MVFIYIDQKGAIPLNELRSEIKLQDDPEFNFDRVVNDFIKEGYVEQVGENNWSITSWGQIEFSDLHLEKLEELNKKAYIIQGIVLALLFIGVMGIVKYLPVFLQWWTEYNSH